MLYQIPVSELPPCPADKAPAIQSDGGTIGSIKMDHLGEICFDGSVVKGPVWVKNCDPPRVIVKRAGKPPLCKAKPKSPE